MRIAILGWGSLIWDPHNLPKEGIWEVGGPKLPIEFSRISSNCRLTLVIDPEQGEKVPTRFVQSPRSDLSDAIEDLRIREGTVKKWIGFVDVKHGRDSSSIEDQAKIHGIIGKWTREKKFDATIWTALPSNFKEETGKDFSIDNAIEHLKGLPESAREKALKYISNAPEDVITPLRRKLIEMFGE